MFDYMSKDEINKLITMRLAGSRPISWEEDISRNTLDTEPFHNEAPVTEREIHQFNNPNRRRVIDPLLGDETLESLISRDSFPIPSADDREGYSRGFDENYWLSGLEDYLKIMQVAKRFGITPKSVLDFGCASGRLVRHYAAQTDITEIWGTDINARHIRWLYEFLPATVKPVFNHCIPSLPIRDNSIDIISAFSVFTHIDTFETCWLAELARILSDEGFAYLTVHNEDTWIALRDQVDNPNNRLIQSILNIDPTVNESIKGPMPFDRQVYRFAQSGPYRAQVFHSNEYLKNVWGRFFTIEEILPLHHVRQTVVVLRKRKGV